MRKEVGFWLRNPHHIVSKVITFTTYLPDPPFGRPVAAPRLVRTFFQALVMDLNRLFRFPWGVDAPPT